MTEPKNNSELSSFSEGILPDNTLNESSKSLHNGGYLVILMIICGLFLNVMINNAYNGSATEARKYISIFEPTSKGIALLLGVSDNCQNILERSTIDNTDPTAIERGRQQCEKAYNTRIQTINTAIWNIALVIIFAVIVRFTTKKASVIIKQVYCDTIYYYGFLLTLFSLILAFATARVGTEADVVPIIINNAIALSSTLAALFFRVLFNLQIKIEESKTDVISDHERQVNLFINSLMRLTTSVNKLQEDIDAHRLSIKESNDKYTATVSTLYNQYDALIFTIDSQTRKITDNLIEISNSISIHTNRISNEMSQYNIEEKLDNKIDKSVKILDRKLENSVMSINGSIQYTSSTVDQLGASLNILRYNIDVLSQNMASSELRIFIPPKTPWQRFKEFLKMMLKKSK